MHLFVMWLCDVAKAGLKLSGFLFCLFVCLSVSLSSPGTAGIHYTWLTLSF